jgi:membrane fusion protein (multidrug efflux system)
MHKKITTLLAVVGLLAAAGVAWWVQNPSKPAPGAEATSAKGPAGASGPGGGGRGGPATVEVGRVERIRLVDDAQAVGSLRAHQSVVLRPEISGRVAAIAFAEGKPVRRGQVLVQLDDALQRAQLRQAEAQAGIARTQLQRNRELVAQGFVSQSAVDQSAAALEVAQAQVALAQVQLARTRIVAPFDALAGVRKVDVGEYVKDGAELVSLEDLSQLWVDFRLPERYLSRVRVGQPVELVIDAFPDRVFVASVQVLDSQVDTEGRSLLVRSRLTQRDAQLKPGMFARARTVLAARDDALVVPEEALVPQGGKQFLVKVVDGEKGPVSQRLEARIGVRLQGKVEILEGLREGERVVTAGQERLMRGDAQPLRIVQVGPGSQGRPAAEAAPAAAASAGARAPA